MRSFSVGWFGLWSTLSQTIGQRQVKRGLLSLLGASYSGSLAPAGDALFLDPKATRCCGNLTSRASQLSDASGPKTIRARESPQFVNLTLYVPSSWRVVMQPTIVEPASSFGFSCAYAWKSESIVERPFSILSSSGIGPFAKNSPTFGEQYLAHPAPP